MRAFTLLLVAATVASVTCVDVWWESAVVYQIYPRSFKDSNGDGIGDLNGIKSKLWYLADTGVDAIWLSPIYKSPMLDFGYDIQNYTDIAEEYGTLADFDALIAEAKKLKIRVVLDYVPNHTSHLSEWFKNSAKSVGKYTDYYIWADGKPGGPNNESNYYPPSNWISIFRKSAWEYNEDRKQYYLHQFVIGQPDINYRSPELCEEMKNVLRFWLDRGVSGFRVDAINMLFEVDPGLHNGTYPDEPRSSATGLTPDDYDYLTHIYTRDQNETYDVVYDWRDVLDEYIVKHNESKIMMTEGYTEISLMMRYYGNGTRNGSIPFNFAYLGELTSTSSARDIKIVVDKWMTYMPTGKVANWVNGNHDQSRLPTRYGVNRVDTMNMLALILPGVSITYQGEELGMTDGNISWVDTQDPQACNTDDPINYWKSSRDPARTPYHWDDTANAGFSTNSSTWLPVASNYQTINLAAEMAATKSHYKFYKDVVALKHTAAVSSGDLETRAISDNVLVVTRISSDNSAVVGVINLSDQPIDVDLTSFSRVPQKLLVQASGVACSVNKGEQVQKNAITMSGHCAMALQSVADSGTGGTDTGTGGTDTGTGGTDTGTGGIGTGTGGTDTGTGGTNGTDTGGTNGTDTTGTGSANRFLLSFTLCIIFFIYGCLVI